MAHVENASENVERVLLVSRKIEIIVMVDRVRRIKTKTTFNLLVVDLRKFLLFSIDNEFSDIFLKLKSSLSVHYLIDLIFISVNLPKNVMVTRQLNSVFVYILFDF
jgi:hypothetical protein